MSEQEMLLKSHQAQLDGLNAEIASAQAQLGTVSDPERMALQIVKWQMQADQQQKFVADCLRNIAAESGEVVEAPAPVATVVELVKPDPVLETVVTVEADVEPVAPEPKKGKKSE